MTYTNVCLYDFSKKTISITNDSLKNRSHKYDFSLWTHSIITMQFQFMSMSCLASLLPKTKTEESVVSSQVHFPTPQYNFTLRKRNVAYDWKNESCKNTRTYVLMIFYVMPSKRRHLLPIRTTLQSIWMWFEQVSHVIW